MSGVIRNGRFRCLAIATRRKSFPYHRSVAKSTGGDKVTDVGTNDLTLSGPVENLLPNLGVDSGVNNLPNASAENAISSDAMDIDKEQVLSGEVQDNGRSCTVPREANHASDGNVQSVNIVRDRELSGSDHADDNSDTPAEEDLDEVPNDLEIERKKQFRMLAKEIKQSITGREGEVLSNEIATKWVQIIEVMEEKYKKKDDNKNWKVKKSGKHPSDTEDFLKRIQGDEEKNRKWMGSIKEREHEIPGMLMRAWDEMSQCQIKDYRVGFLSGGSMNRLDTFNNRKMALGHHADWGNRHKTAFISFSSSLEEIGASRVPHFQKRQAKKGILENTKLTLINTRVRLAAGKPVLRMKTELIHYNVVTREGDLSRRNNSWYEHEYILPFSCGPDEIVATWSWPVVEKWIKDNDTDFNGWCREVGIPAFKEHERVRLGGTPKEACKKGCDCCGH